MRNNYFRFLFISIIFFTLFLKSFGQNKYQIAAYIEDSLSGERLAGVEIVVPSLKQSFRTNIYGFFSFVADKPVVDISVNYFGYIAKELSLSTSTNNTKDDIYTISLLKDSITNNKQLKEVMVSSSQKKYKEAVLSTTMGQMSITGAEVQKLPRFMGETDVLRTIQLLPGVQSGNEGTAGLFVRGGSPDQNLILLDGSPIYNVYHLFGIFSVFHSGSIKNVDIIKGNFPARYGGRLSSVLDISMKDGNMKNVSGEFNQSVIATTFSLEAPIIKDKMSFIISGRRTWFDLLSYLFQSLSSSNGGASGGYYFYDFNAKLNYKASEKDRFFLSFYSGRDKFYANVNTSSSNVSSKQETELSWGNLTSVLRWNHIFNRDFFLNTSLYYTGFDFLTQSDVKYNSYGNDFSNTQIFAQYRTNINDLGARLNAEFTPIQNHLFRFGGNIVYHFFEPGYTTVKFNTQSTYQNFNFDTSFGLKQNAIEGNIYAEDDFIFAENFKANLGVNASFYNISNKNYFNIEPRVSLRYLFNDQFAIKTSFSQTNQYIHLLAFSGLGLPLDIWVPATEKVPPQKAWQVALGGAYNFYNDMFTLSAEMYYKQMQGNIDYKDGESAFSNKNWQNKVEAGQGTAYGLELFFEKKKGKTRGWVAYTLSWSNRQYETINGGKEFPFKYDRRHDAKIVLMQDFIRPKNKRIELSFTGVFSSANPVSIPFTQASYVSLKPMQTFSSIQEQGIFNTVSGSYISSRNNYRIQNYFRIDFSISFIKKWKTKHPAEGSLNIGIYNVLFTKNAVFFFPDLSTSNNAQLNLKGIVILPFLPSIGYSIKF